MVEIDIKVFVKDLGLFFILFDFSAITHSLSLHANCSSCVRV